MISLSVEFVFLMISIIIIIGYLGLILFKKTKISEIVVLLLLGLMIGPIATELGFVIIGPVEFSLFESFLPFFASFALIMILFEGGMSLNFFKTIKALPSSLAFTISVFCIGIIFTVISLFGLGQIGFFEFDPLLAIFIGAIVGGTSSAVIVPVVRNTRACDETKTLLNLESALTDSLCVISVVAIAEVFLLGAISYEAIISSILANFSIAAVLGFTFGIMWLKILSFIHKRKYEYLATISSLLLLYVLVQTFGGNGAIAALVFGIVLGNSEDITKMLRLRKRSIDVEIRIFQDEISFLIKTFFFVYLGVLFRLDYLTTSTILISILIIFFALISRFIVSSILKKLNPIFEKDQKLISFMMARGLAAAVLVSIPITMGLDIIAPEIFTPEMIGQITAIAFLTILGTNIMTTIGVFITEGKNSNKQNKEKGEALKELRMNASNKSI